MSTIDTAIVLAAGRGTRLKERTEEKPKPMIKVNTVPIIDNLIDGLIQAGLKNIVVVVGYMKDQLIDNLSKFKGVNMIFVENPDYLTTNNIYSLWLAKEYMNEGFFLFEADVFCEKKLIGDLFNALHDNVIVIDRYTPEMDGTVVELDDADRVKSMYLKRHQGEGFSFDQTYKTVNFYKLSKSYIRNYFFPTMDKHIKHNDVNVYYEQIIKEDIDNGFAFYSLKTGDSRWWEIDDFDDLQKAEHIFSDHRP